MGPCFRLRSMAVALMVALATSTASANLTLPDDEDEKSDEKKGGNAIDKTTARPATTERPMTGAGSIPPEAYGLLGEFWGSMLAGDYAGAAWAIADSPESPPEADFSYLKPIDGPAESVLDQLDESQAPLPMAGEPGSEVTVAAEAPTPPPESILDFIDTAPAPQPAAGPTQEASKPAVDQAPKPAMVKTPPP